MPIFEQRLAVAVRGLKAFLNLEVGLIRGEAPAVGAGPDQNDRELQKLRRELAEKDRTLAKLRAGSDGAVSVGIEPGDIVWLLGNPKTGSTWLSWMLEELTGNTVWREPYVGRLFGLFYHEWEGERHFDSKHFILGGPQRESWLRSIRAFVLAEAGDRFPEVARDGGRLVVKEPNGSMGASLLMDALPESPMVFLIRDPRDVAASALDAGREGSYMHQRRKGGKHAAVFEMQADDVVERTATNYLRNVGDVKEAYDTHPGPKVFVRYEELRSDTLKTVRRICSTLKMPVDDEQLVRAVEKHSWENIPDENKGEGKVFRKAKPGGWSEDLTPSQIETVERITAPLLEEYYPTSGVPR